MNTFEKLINIIGTLNLDQNYFDEELTQKMKLKNLIVLLISPLILIAIIYLYYFVGNIEKTLAMLIFLFFFLSYIFLKGENKKYIYFINMGFLLSALIIINNIISKQGEINIQIQDYILPKITLMISFIASILFIPMSYRKIFSLSILYNISAFLGFEFIMKFFNIDFYSIGSDVDIIANNYRDIIFIFNINFIALVILIAVYNYASTRTNNKLKFQLRTFRSSSDKLKDDINTLTNKNKTLTNDLDHLQNKRFNYFIDWKKYNKSKSHFHIKYDFTSGILINDSIESKEKNALNYYSIDNENSNLDDNLLKYKVAILLDYINKSNEKNNFFISESIDENDLNLYYFDYVPYISNSELQFLYVFLYKKDFISYYQNSIESTTKFFEYLFSHFNEIIIMFDNYGKILFHTDIIEEKLEYSKSEFDKLYIYELTEFIKKNDLTNILNVIKKSKFKSKLKLISKYGKNIYLDSLFHHFEIEGENYYLLLGRDNEEDIRFKDEIRRKDDELNYYLNTINGTVYKCKINEEWTFIYSTDTILQLSGYDKNEFYDAKINYGDLILDEYKQFVWDKVIESINLKTNFDIEYKIKTKSGEIKWVKERGFSIEDEIRNEIVLYGFIQDITNEKKFEKKVAEFENRFIRVLDNINSMVAIYDVKGKPVYLNKAFIEFYNMQDVYEDYLKNYNLLMDERIKDNPKLYEAIQKAIVGETLDEFEYVIPNYQEENGLGKKLKFNAKIIPYFDKFQLNQMIVFVINFMKIEE